MLRIDGFRFFFFSNEGNEPPHIHVRKGEALGKWWLDPIEQHSAEGFSKSELRRISRIISENREFLIGQWNQYFG